MCKEAGGQTATQSLNTLHCELHALTYITKVWVIAFLLLSVNFRQIRSVPQRMRASSKKYARTSMNDQSHTLLRNHVHDHRYTILFVCAQTEERHEKSTINTHIFASANDFSHASRFGMESNIKWYAFRGVKRRITCKWSACPRICYCSKRNCKTYQKLSLLPSKSSKISISSLSKVHRSFSLRVGESLRFHLASIWLYLSFWTTYPATIFHIRDE